MLLAIATIASVAITACSSDSGGGDGDVAVTLITKNSTNPFFVTMQEGAKAAAKAENVKSRSRPARRTATSRPGAGHRGRHRARTKRHPHHPNGPGVNRPSRRRAIAGLYVIALDTPPDPANTVDITFATDNFKAGELIGKWTRPIWRQAGDDRDARPVQRQDRVGGLQPDQGFLTGMGIDTKDKKKNGDEAKTR
jgi:fructose transport system substrate-binding protein